MKTTTVVESAIVSVEFMERFGSEVTGIVGGFDRLGLRWTLRLLHMADGMAAFLETADVFLKDFNQ